ncbi:MAG: hypothetical protein IJV88_01745 [Ruminococcus sp.]|nr:hypothetical protein [Ruminococcus sp.]
MRRRRTRRRSGDYFIGMVDSYSRRPGYSKRRRRSKKQQTQLYIRRGIIVAVCLLIIVAIVWIMASIIGGISSCVSNCSSDKEPAEETTTKTTQPATNTPPVTEEGIALKKPYIDDNGADGELITSTLYLWNKAAYNLFGYSESAVNYYAQTVNSFADTLEDVTVYNMVVPNHTEFGLPQRLIDGGVSSMSQADNLTAIMNATGDNVIDVNCYTNLAEHNTDYIYFNTDHHWTGLGAYYGYTAFCKEAGLAPMDIEGLEKNTIAGFVGSFHDICNSNAAYGAAETLASNADVVEYYTLPNYTYATMKEDMTSEPQIVDVYYPASPGSLTYGTFCWGDVAEFVISSDAGTGKKIALIKDSYGNALAPYLTANYDEIHILDFRYWSGDLKSYLTDNGIEELLILNNVMSANTALNTDQLAALLG